MLTQNNNPERGKAMLPNILRAVLLAALFGAAVLVLGGVLTNLGRKAGTAVRSVA